VELPDVSVSVRVAAPAEVVWAAVADPTRIASWSPENTGANAGGVGPLPVGAAFDGSNRNGRFRWSTSCVVVESTPGAAFAFDVSYLGMAVARWRYAITATAEGCLVEEQWWDRRRGVLKSLGFAGTGVRDRVAHNTHTMRQTLAVMRADLEGR